MITRIDPDYLHVATEGPLGLALRGICKARGWNFTTQYHTHFPLYVKARMGEVAARIAIRYLRWFHTASGALMVSTSHLADELVRLGFRRPLVVPLGVDTERFVRLPESVTTLPGPVFAYMGRVSVEKNIEEFLCTDLPGTKLVIGDGPLRTILQHRHPEAHFVGYQHGKDLVRWLSSADVFVFPSRTETFGLVVLEALSCGLPVAAHDVMGPGDIITHGVDGRLGDDLRDAALACLTLGTEAPRATALRYTWEAAADAFERCLISRHVS
jgi:glycosyltransferase involved in cell wall biosynthesis